MEHGGNLRLINEYEAVGKLGGVWGQSCCREEDTTSVSLFSPRKVHLFILEIFFKMSECLDGEYQMWVKKEHLKEKSYLYCILSNKSLA